MNILLEGDEPPWCESEWVGRSIQLGTATLKVMGLLPRCPAPDSDPLTGERNLRLTSQLRAHFGHENLGVLARVETAGALVLGDLLQPI
jgi:uncharacterized protein YcbX